MTDIHLASVAIYCDLQNVYSIQKLANLLLAFANTKGRLFFNKVYYNSQCKSQTSAKDKLESLGFHCVDVPCPLKDSADNQLKADCIDDVFNNGSPDIVILVSGDGDFANLVRNLRELGKKVIIFAQRGNVKQRLKELAGNDFHFVDELPELVGDKTQPQTNCVQSQITDKEATECLIEAIKTASRQGKRTVLGCIDTLMRKHFPNYRGATSILKQDGTTFSRFSKFVDTVVKEGKVRMENQELFLI